MKKIEIYTSDTCIQCKKAKEYFQRNVYVPDDLDEIEL